MDWKTKINLAAVWPSENPKLISGEVVDELTRMDLSFLTEDDPVRQMRDELVGEFKGLAEQEDPDVDDFDAALEYLYDWADTPLVSGSVRQKLCWISTDGAGFSGAEHVSRR